MVAFILLASIVFFIWLIAIKFSYKIGDIVFKYIIDPILNIFK